MGWMSETEINFLTRKNVCKLWNFLLLFFFLVEADVKFRNLEISKILNSNINRMFSISIQNYLHVKIIYRLLDWVNKKFSLKVHQCEFENLPKNSSS